jgi:hypothetical protein
VHKKKKKGRQGRSREVRERKKREREEQRIFMEQYKCFNFERCPDCGRQDGLIQDSHSGELICNHCGCVSELGGGLAFSTRSIMPSQNQMMSKPYQRVVHFRQRIAQLLCIDPEVELEHVHLIDEWLYLFSTREDEVYMGIKTFSRICKELGIDTKVATHWMQIRKRLGIRPYSDGETLPGELVQRICMRYFCISQAFDKTLKKGHRGEFSILKRNNMLNLNYTIVQLIRMEDEEVFRRIFKFVPQLISHQQPMVNNRRWKILMEYCSQNYSLVSDPSKGQFYSFSWDYIPLTVEDLLRYFYFFV